MNILDIKNPDFLKNLNNKELEQVSSDIRKFLLDNISVTGGHLSSNLGVVELTIAMHKVFNSPNDKFLFDVGHQSYTHKILTGRAEGFKNLRKFKGLSGFQKMCESEHDHFEAGHSTTSISGALGFAVSRDLYETDEHVIAIIGDGSITGGMAYEALNHAGQLNKKLIVILNDNEMSISENVGGLHNSLDGVRSSTKYRSLKKSFKRTFNSIPGVGDVLYNTSERTKDILKKAYVKKGFIFEELGLNYYGPIDGHDFKELIYYLNLVKREENPVILHVITQKGRGYKFAENDIFGHWHGTGPFHIETGMSKQHKNCDEISWSEVISNTLIRLAEKNSDIVAITPAMEVGSKLSKFKKQFPNRFFDVGIAEEHAATFCSSLALNGHVPFLSIYSTFLQRAYDQINHDIARQKAGVIIGVDRAGIVGSDGETHQGIYDLALLNHIPNMVICMPKDSVEAQNLLYTLSKLKQPSAIRYPRGTTCYTETKFEEIEVGKFVKLRSGVDISLIGYGPKLNMILELSEELSKINIEAAVYNARFIKPFDTDLIDKLSVESKPIFVIEDSAMIGSLGSIISQYVHQQRYKNLVYNFALPDIYIEQGNDDIILEELSLSKNDIKNKIMEIINE